MSSSVMLMRNVFTRRLIHSSPRRMATQSALEKGGDETGASKSTSSGKAYVVTEPLESEKPYGVPSGVYSSGEPMPADSSTVPNSHSSTSASPPHPKLAKDALNGDLSERNAWPSEEQGKMGREEAWKHRK